MSQFAEEDECPENEVFEDFAHLVDGDEGEEEDGKEEDFFVAISESILEQQSRKSSHLPDFYEQKEDYFASAPRISDYLRSKSLVDSQSTTRYKYSSVFFKAKYCFFN